MVTLNRLLCSAAILAAPSIAQFVTQLQSLVTSHGKLNPPFAPNVTSYSLSLETEVDVLTLSTAVLPSNKAIGSYYQIQGTPEVIIEYPDKENNGKPEPSYTAVRANIDLPDDGSNFDISITVRDNAQLEHHATYQLHITQKEPVAALRGISAVDDTGARIATDPFVDQDTSLFNLYVDPKAKSVSLKATCASGNTVKVNNQQVTSGVTIKRELNHHKQLVPIECIAHTGASVHHMVMITSDYKKDNIPLPKLVLADKGLDCDFKSDGAFFQCPDPKSRDGKASLIAYLDPSVRYTLEAKDVQLRVLDGVPTMSFPYTSRSFELLGLAGAHNVTWPVRFAGNGVSNLIKFLGWALGFKLVALLASLLAVLGFTSLGAIGSPIGVTEVAAALAFLMQFFSFASVSRGTDDDSLLSRMNSALRWTTLYFPAPFKLKEQSNNGSAAKRLLAEVNKGKEVDIQLAYGCVFWCAIIMAALAIVHCCIAIRRRMQKDATFPHRLRFGNWESRALHFLCFPLTVASSQILLSNKTGPLGKVVAGTVLVALCAWALSVWGVMQSAMNNKDVVWVWDSSIHEDGHLESSAGFWSDVHCDQLLTHPVNRSLCKRFFPWRWVSTVADIDPVEISGGSRGKNAFAPNEFGGSSTSVQGKSARNVQVFKTVPPGKCCPGSRLICGLLRSSWIDILFTYEGLTTFFSKAEHNNNVEVPLTVKTCQLSGPITGGANHFFWDGTRVPFIRIADALFRILAGILMGTVLASLTTNNDKDYSRFFTYPVLGIVALAFMVYVSVRVPFARTIENWVEGLTLLSIGTAALALGFANIFKDNNSSNVITSIFLWVTAISAGVLSIYACIVTLSLYGAIMCPPLEETRFLEKLANCTVVIADHAAGWATHVPAYNKVGTSGLKAQCLMTGPKRVSTSVYPSGAATLEFDPSDILNCCNSGNLPQPAASVTCADQDDSLGYRHSNCYDRAGLQADIAGFLAMGRDTRHLADSVARGITGQVIQRGGRGVVALDIVPPVAATHSASSSSAAGTSPGSASVSSLSQY